MNICMPLYAFYEIDSRVIRYTEALVERGDRVDVIALNSGGMAPFEIIRGVNVYRIQERKINEKNRFSYLSRVLRFTLNSMIFLNKQKIKYDLFHVHSIPDFLVFSTIFQKIRGAKVILDIHDLVPELYLDKFGLGKDSSIFKIMILLEKLSCNFSDYVIIANHLWEETIQSRSVKNGKLVTLMNYPDDQLFFPRKRPKDTKNKLMILYPGSLNSHQGVDLAVEAFNQIHMKIPEAEFHIYGSGPLEETLVNMISDYQLSNQIKIHRLLPLDQIVPIMAEADIGIVPKRGEGFGGEAFSTKTLEFMALGVPLLVSKTRIDQHYFNGKLVKFFSPGDPNDLANKLLDLIKNKKERDLLSQNAMAFVQDFTWDKKKQEYLDLIDRLVNRTDRRSS